MQMTVCDKQRQQRQKNEARKQQVQEAEAFLTTGALLLVLAEPTYTTCQAPSGL
jgi:hypothetical protein